VRRRTGAGLAAAASVVAFAAGAFLRMNAAYGPFNLSGRPGDWMVLWELLRHQQIAAGVVWESILIGTLGALVPWLLFGLSARRRRMG
jgi:hypothetical protein